MSVKRKRSGVAKEKTGTASGTLKPVWHPLSLQQMRPSQFIDVVNRVLEGRDELCQGTLRGATCVGEVRRSPEPSELTKPGQFCPY
jgi:hypothetical protein